MVGAKNHQTETGKVLIYREMDLPVVEQTRVVVENGLNQNVSRETNLHVWHVGKVALRKLEEVHRTHSTSPLPLMVLGDERVEAAILAVVDVLRTPRQVLGQCVLCWVIQAYFTAFPARSTPSLFLRCRVPS